MPFSSFFFFFTLSFLVWPRVASWGVEPAAWDFPSASESLEELLLLLLLLESEELRWPCRGFGGAPASGRP